MYNKDTIDFINRLRKLPTFPSGTILVMLDVTWLHTNIPHKEAIISCTEFLNLRDPLVLTTADLCHLIQSTLTTNSFSFNKNHFSQIERTVMGTLMEPSYVNLFMGKLEHEFLRTQDIVPLVWWRFADDIFVNWSHGKHALCHFTESLNRHHPSSNLPSPGQ